MNDTLTHGSLFSGSGGFDEAARMNGIRTLWCSEIEPFPIRVLKKHFPDAEQLGDISKIDGGKIAPVDIISGGSPCQDMSIAGKREGLDGDRSTLFHEQVRIVKEMREKTDGKYPRYMVWENVPGAFSSNGGEDFRCVLQEILNAAGANIYVPRPSGRGGKWSYAGADMADGYSVAWRVMDAQYWGVPQRRRRIYLVADFRGTSAPQILFERESLSWNPTQSRIEREGTAGGVGKGSASADREGAVPIENHPNDSRVGICEDGKCQTLTSRMGTGGGNVPLLMEPVSIDARHSCDVVRIADTVPTIQARDFKGGNYIMTPKAVRERAGCDGGGKGPLIQDNVSRTLTVGNDQAIFQPVAFGLCSKDSNAMKSDNPNSGFYEAETSRTLDCKGGNPTCNQGGIVVCEPMAFEPGAASRVGGHIYEDGKSGTLRARPGDNNQAVVIPIEGNGQRPSHKGDGYNDSDKEYTLNATEVHGVAYGIDRAAFNQGVNAQFGISIEEEKMQTIVAKGPKAVAQPVPEIEYIVRRLTPMECARLQGLDDDWTDGLTEDEAVSDIRFWTDVWLEQWVLIGRDKGIKRPKTEKQVKKWLETEPSDSDKYKLWGNGIALPCAFYVFEGIKQVLSGETASQ